jgi:hypothetical protein
MRASSSASGALDRSDASGSTADFRRRTLPARRHHRLKVLTKEAGTWRIVSDLYMDARDDSTL